MCAVYSKKKYTKTSVQQDALRAKRPIGKMSSRQSVLKVERSTIKYPKAKQSTAKCLIKSLIKPILYFIEQFFLVFSSKTLLSLQVTNHKLLNQEDKSLL